MIPKIPHFLPSMKRGISVSEMKRHNKGTLNSTRLCNDPVKLPGSMQ